MAAERAPVPAWLDAAFAERALRSDGGASPRVVGVTARHANAPGDHYASEMFRVRARLADGGERSLITKSLPEGKQFRRFVAEADVFKVEGDMFLDAVPRMRARLEAVAPGRFSPIIARCLMRESTTDRQLLVFEDLSEQGFQLADRHRGLGLRHSLLAVRSLARFHASSRALIESPEELEMLSALPNPFHSVREAFEKIITNNFRLLATEIKQWKGFERYSDTIRNLVDVAFDKFAELNTFDPSAFHVLVHGDFWVNNMMFRYEEGRPDEVRFCDLQISHLGPPVIDLIYFLFSSVSEDVSERHVDLLLRAYHAELSDALELLGCERRLPWKELHAQLHACGVYATLTVFGVLPIIKADAAKAFDTERAMDGGGAADAAHAHLFRSPTYMRWARRLLPQFERDGWLHV